jgi:two-component system, cell cycle sensor histidine kinase and response regulator CckA
VVDLRSRPARHAMDTATADLYGARVVAELARHVERARVAETRYLTLFEAATDAIAILDESGTLIEVNPRWEEILGVPREQIIGHSVRDFAVPELADTNVALVRKAAGSRQDLQRFAVRGAGGKVLWFEGNSTPIVADGRRLVFSISRNVTAAIAAQAELERSEAKYRTLLDNIPDVVWTARADGSLEFVTANCERILGYTPAELMPRFGRPDEIFPADRDQVMATWHTFLAGGGSFDVEYRRRHADGRWIWVHNRALARSCDVTRAIDGIMTDVSERKRLEDQMRQAQKLEAVGQLSGGVAHDFNNLLAVIMANCHFLLEALADHDPRRADALEIESAGARAAQLTRQLLAFSRRQALAPMLCDLAVTVAGLEKMLHRLIGEDIDLVVTPGADVGAVRVDVGQIEQVVMNLVVNARDAMPDGGTIAIELGNADVTDATAFDDVMPGRYVVLSVSDTGCGMDAETRRRIFEPFFTTKELGKGTGLGLSTCYGIVRQSGGAIYVYSEPGHGSTFKVFLPRVDGDAAPSVRREIAAIGGSETVLVIEDEDRVRAAVIRMLTARGYRVLGARTAADAIAIARNHRGRLDLVLSDVILPGARGTEAVEQLQQLSPGTRALFMSGYTDHVALRTGLLEDGRSLIQKPFSMDALAHKVREVLDSPGQG